MTDCIHIYPVDTRHRSMHKTDAGADCWCEPQVKQLCQESDAKGQCVPDCHRCGGTANVLPYDDALPRLLIHSQQRRRTVMHG